MDMTEPTFPGAIPPERRRSVRSHSLTLNLLEWGDPGTPPLLLCHGMWDHAHSFSVLAPLLAERFHVLALDARGHGDSDWAHAYTWLADLGDIVAVLRSLGRPAQLVGHSKGGGQTTEAACIVPELVTKLVNIDGFGPPPMPNPYDRAPAELARLFDLRRGLSRRDTWRPYSSLDQLVERRRSQNPRLSREWLRYFSFHGAREEADGWRWKSDPHMAHGYGPWRPEWIGPRYAALRCPMLAIVGSETDTWGPLPEPILAERLAFVPDLERRVVAGAGHFVHIERPAETAALILDFLEQ